MKNINIKKLKEEILENEKIKKIIEENNLTDLQIDDSMSIFFDIINDSKNEELMYTSEIILQPNGTITRKLIPTKKGEQLENEKKFVLKNVTVINHSLLLSKTNNQKIKNNEFMWNEGRKDLANYFKEVILKNLKNNEYFKGLYIYGDFGIGKSFFTQALANYFASKNKTVAYININDLSNHLKQLFSIGYKKTIDDLKDVDFLFIDDIGSEKSSAWMISEILFSILSYRMQINKTTFFTSNFSYKQLEKEFTKGTEISGFKAKRLMERIEVLSVPILLKDKNWRKL